MYVFVRKSISGATVVKQDVFRSNIDSHQFEQIIFVLQSTSGDIR